MSGYTSTPHLTPLIIPGGSGARRKPGRPNCRVILREEMSGPVSRIAELNYMYDPAILRLRDFFFLVGKELLGGL